MPACEITTMDIDAGHVIAWLVLSESDAIVVCFHYGSATRGTELSATRFSASLGGVKSRTVRTSKLNIPSYGLTPTSTKLASHAISPWYNQSYCYFAPHTPRDELFLYELDTSTLVVRFKWKQDLSIDRESIRRVSFSADERFLVVVFTHNNSGVAHCAAYNVSDGMPHRSIGIDMPANTPLCTCVLTPDALFVNYHTMVLVSDVVAYSCGTRAGAIPAYTRAVVPASGSYANVGCAHSSSQAAGRGGVVLSNRSGLLETCSTYSAFCDGDVIILVQHTPPPPGDRVAQVPFAHQTLLWMHADPSALIVCTLADHGYATTMYDPHTGARTGSIARGPIPYTPPSGMMFKLGPHHMCASWNHKTQDDMLWYSTQHGCTPEQAMSVLAGCSQGQVDMLLRGRKVGGLDSLRSRVASRMTPVLAKLRALPADVLARIIVEAHSGVPAGDAAAYSKFM